MTSRCETIKNQSFDDLRVRLWLLKSRVTCQNENV